MNKNSEKTLDFFSDSESMVWLRLLVYTGARFHFIYLGRAGLMKGDV